MDPVTYRNAAGDERVVTSRAGVVAAEFDGFYAPDSPSGRRLAGQKAAATRKAKADATTRKRTETAPDGPTPAQVDTGAAEPSTPTT